MSSVEFKPKRNLMELITFTTEVPLNDKMIHSILLKSFFSCQSMRIVCSRLLTGIRYSQYRIIRNMATQTQEFPVAAAIKKKLSETFKPDVLDVINESYMHNVPKGSETHFKVVVVANQFESLPLIKRHRLVNTALQEELNSGVHALSIIAKTPKQWEDSEGKVSKSPACRGGTGL